MAKPTITSTSKFTLKLNALRSVAKLELFLAGDTATNPKIRRRHRHAVEARIAKLATKKASK